MPSSLEPGPSHNTARYFTPSDVFTVLYGKNTAQQASQDGGRGAKATAQLRTAERINPGELSIKSILNCFVSCLPKTKSSHARLRGNFEYTRVSQN